MALIPVLCQTRKILMIQIIIKRKNEDTDSWFVAKYTESIQEKQKRLKKRFSKVKGRSQRKKRSGRRKRH
jgi:hypothetical protein